MTWFSVESSSFARFYLMLNTAGQIFVFWRGKFYKHALTIQSVVLTSDVFQIFIKNVPWSTSNRIVQNVAQFSFSLPLGKSLNIIEKKEGLSLFDTSFDPRDSPRPLKKIEPACSLVL